MTNAVVVVGRILLMLLMVGVVLVVVVPWLDRCLVSLQHCEHSVYIHSRLYYIGISVWYRWSIRVTLIQRTQVTWVRSHSIPCWVLIYCTKNKTNGCIIIPIPCAWLCWEQEPLDRTQHQRMGSYTAEEWWVLLWRTLLHGTTTPLPITYAWLVLVKYMVDG